MEKNIQKIFKKMNLFWQYPVITEKIFNNQQKKNPLFIGIPWATIIDKKLNTNKIQKYFKNYKNLYTCCQHIHFRKLIPLFKSIGITVLYTPHKVEDNIKGITIEPCPLYAVNIEDPYRNMIFRNKNFNEIDRDILYSFYAGYQTNYMTKVRLDIFKMNHPDNCVVNNTGEWHFNKDVYT